MRIINFRLTFDIIVRKIEKGGLVVREKDYQVSCCETLHSVPSFAYCLEDLIGQAPLMLQWQSA